MKDFYLSITKSMIHKVLTLANKCMKITKDQLKIIKHSRKPLLFENEKHHHHLHVALSARISLTLSCHSSLSSIATGRASGLHPVSAQSCCMYVLPGRPVFAPSCEGVHRCTSLMSTSLLLQQCPACLVPLILIVFVMGGWLVAVQLLLCGVLSPGLVKYCSQHSCVVAVKFFFQYI